LFVFAGSAAAQARFAENFDNVGPTNIGQDGPQNLINQGWIFRNQSYPRGARSWHDGYLPEVGAWPAPQSGPGYIAVESNSTDFFGGRVSNWAILPRLSGQRAGDILTFYALNMASSNVPTLQVRCSPNGGSNTGSGADTVGDFTQLLLDVNPLPVGGWNLYRVTLPGYGRVALRYFIKAACNFACFGAYTGIDSLNVGDGAPPPPPCNQPPAPSAGQTVIWRASGSPYEVCQNISIPPGGTVIVEPGVRVDFDADKQLVVSGALVLQGNSAAPIRLSSAAAFPPILDAVNGTVNATFTNFAGQFLVESGSTVNLSDCTFFGNGLLRSKELPSIAPYVRLERCQFNSSGASMSDALVVLRNNIFSNSFAMLLRGYADVTAPNTFTGGPLSIIRESNIQPLYVNGLTATGVSNAAGLWLDGGNYLLGPQTVLQNNLYSVQVKGGLLPGSTVPRTGNVNNVIDVANGGFSGDGFWSNLGVPYRLTQLPSSLPGGRLTISPGVTVEADPGTRLTFRSTRRLIADGLPNAPITFRSTTPGQICGGLNFDTNSTEGPRLEYCNIRDAQFGATSSDNTLFVENCFFQNNAVGANANTYGAIYFGKTRFFNNAIGANLTDLGHLGLMNLANPNAFEGNGAAIDAFEPGSNTDARQVWWGDPTGPRHPLNPSGLGDPIIGPGANWISIFPFLTAAPDAANTPPVVRVIEPGFSWTGHSASPSHVLDQGTKYIIRWEAQDTDAIVTQRILFSADGHSPDRFVVVADGLPPDQRSYEWVVPDPGYAVTNQPQFLRVVAVDAAGQEGWDQMPVVVPSTTITTDLSGMTFYAGQPIPTLDWTGSVSGFPGIEPHIVLEADGTTIEGIALSGQGMFFWTFPEVSTDTARLAIRARNTSNDVKWFFAPGYFSIRHDPRLNLVPPAVQIITPAEGASYGSGAVVPISWTASDDEALHSFDIQASYDNALTWHLIARDLPAGARCYNWPLPPDGSIPNVQVRVIARDIRFQNSSSRTNRGFNIGQPVLTLSSLTLNPTSTTAGSSSLGTVTLSALAPTEGVVVALSSSNTSVATVPANITVPAGATSVPFAVATGAVIAQSSATISATYAGATRATTLTVFPLTRLSSLTLNPATVVSGASSQGIVALSNAAPAGGVIVNLSSNNTGVAAACQRYCSCWIDERVIHRNHEDCRVINHGYHFLCLRRSIPKRYLDRNAAASNGCREHNARRVHCLEEATPCTGDKHQRRRDAEGLRYGRQHVHRHIDEPRKGHVRRAVLLACRPAEHHDHKQPGRFGNSTS
jgi:hypothetical protein